MNFQHRHFGQITTVDPLSKATSVDVGALVRRLILFDECRLDSDLLKEIPSLVRVFGADGLLELMDSGALRIVLDVMTPAELSQATHDGVLGRSNPNKLPPDGFRFGLATGIDEGKNRRDYVSLALLEVRKSNLPHKEDQRLRLAIAQRVLLKPRSAGVQGLDETCTDLERQDPLMLDGIRMAFRHETGEDLPSSISFSVERLAEKDFRIQLSDPDLTASELGRKVIVRGVLGVAGLNQTINCMSALQAITGLQDGESHLFTCKMRGLAERHLSNSQEEQFERVISIGGLPTLDDLSPETRINVKQLMKIREGDDCTQLREWLRNASDVTNLEIADQFSDLHSRIAHATQSKAGKAARFFTAALAGSIPIAGMVLGPAVGAVDQFLLDNMIGKPGPAMFLSHNYPSLFLQPSV